MASSETIASDSAASEWAALAAASLPEDPTLASLARKTLDGPAIAALYCDRPGSGDGQRVAPKPDSAALCAPSESARTSKAPDRAASASSVDNRVLIRRGNVAERRQQILEALEGGATSLELPIVDAGESLQAVLSDVFLDMATISLQAGEATAEAADALLSCWDARDIAPQAAAAEFNADPLATLARQGFLTNGVDEAITQMTTLAAATAKSCPQVTAISIDTAIQNNAGASPRLELVAGIATASRYLEALIDTGLAPDSCARQLVFRVAVDSDFLMNVVKIRSLRRLWLHVLRHLHIADAPVRIVAVTSGRELSTREPWINHLRHVSGSMAALAGGVDALLVLPHDRVDEHLIGDDERLGDRMARNVALVLQEESWMNTVHDPLAGSYAAEHLTHELCAQVWTGLRELQTEGGYLDALISGSWQQRLAEVQAQRMQAMASGERVMVGVNRFVDEDQADRCEDTRARKNDANRKEADTPGMTRVARLEPQRDARAFGS